MNWIDARVAPPPKDGTTILGAFWNPQLGRYGIVLVQWEDSWQSSDLQLPGVWTDGMLLAVVGEPEFWLLPTQPQGRMG